MASAMVDARYNVRYCKQCFTFDRSRTLPDLQEWGSRFQNNHGCGDNKGFSGL